MCGIVGYVGPRDAVSIILNGLKRLEYRGYDSAGVAVINSNQIEVRRDAGKLSQLVDLVAKSPLSGDLPTRSTNCDNLPASLLTSIWLLLMTATPAES